MGGLLSVALQPIGPALNGWHSVVGEVSVAVGRERVFNVNAIRPLGGEWALQEGKIWAKFGRFPPKNGSHVIIAGRSSPFVPTTRSGASDPKRDAARGRVRSYMSVSEWSYMEAPRQRCVVPHDTTGLLVALACGDRRGVSLEHRRLFRRTGVAHLLAISGFHVGLVMGWVYGLVRGAQRLVSLVWPKGLDAFWAALISVYAAWSYVVLAGSPVSGVRALWMCSAALLFRAFGVPSRAEDLVGMAACVAVVIDPCVVSTVSFQLSYGAVCGLVRFGPALSGPRTWKTWWFASAQTSMAATAGTLPAVAWWFQDLSQFGVWVNVWALPWVAMVVVPLAFVSAMGVPWVSLVAARWGNQSAALFVWSLAPFDVEPLHPSVGAWGALLLAAVLVSSLSVRTSALFALLILTIGVVSL